MTSTSDGGECSMTYLSGTSWSEPSGRQTLRLLEARLLMCAVASVLPCSEKQCASPLGAALSLALRPIKLHFFTTCRPFHPHNGPMIGKRGHTGQELCMAEEANLMALLVPVLSSPCYCRPAFSKASPSVEQSTMCSGRPMGRPRCC